MKYNEKITTVKEKCVPKGRSNEMRGCDKKKEHKETRKNN
jgi:hypothetical protein